METTLPERARGLLVQVVGTASPPRDASLADVVAAVPPARLRDDGDWSTEPEDRVRHARGQSLPDWIAVRSGRLGAVPDAVARPADAGAIRALLERGRTDDLRYIPYGGGMSVVGGVTTPDSDRPVVAIDLERTSGLRALRRSGSNPRCSSTSSWRRSRRARWA